MALWLSFNHGKAPFDTGEIAWLNNTRARCASTARRTSWQFARGRITSFTFLSACSLLACGCHCGSGSASRSAAGAACSAGRESSGMNHGSVREVAAAHLNAAETLMMQQIDRLRGIARELTRGDYLQAALEELDQLQESIEQTLKTTLKIIELSK